MCDCYDEKCFKCREMLPVHIADFCMPRESIRVFCKKHIPDKDILIYAIVNPPSYELSEYPVGYEMGIRYLKEPPATYGPGAVSPNIGGDYLIEWADTRRNSKYTVRIENGWVTDLNQAYDKEIRFCKNLIKQNKDTGTQNYLQRKINEWKAIRHLQEVRKQIPEILKKDKKIKELKKRKRLVSILLIGSARNGDFVPGLSDIDFYVIAENIKHDFKLNYIKDNLEYSVIYSSPSKFVKFLKKGRPIELVTLIYGDELYGRFIKKLKKQYLKKIYSRKLKMDWKYRFYIAGKNMERAFNQYLRFSCGHCFVTNIFHTVRNYLCTYIYLQKKKIIEGKEIEWYLHEFPPPIQHHYNKILSHRENYTPDTYPSLNPDAKIKKKMLSFLTSAVKIAAFVYSKSGKSYPDIPSVIKKLRKKYGYGKMDFITIDSRKGEMVVFISNKELHTEKIIF